MNPEQIVENGGGARARDTNWPGARIALLGPSYSEQATYSASGASGSTIGADARHPLVWAQVVEPRGIFVNWYDAAGDYSRSHNGLNFGKSGALADEIIGRIPKVLASKPAVVILESPLSNDIASPSSLTGGADLPTCIGKMKLAISLLQRGDCEIIVTTELMRYSAYGGNFASGGTGRYVTESYNAWLRSYAPLVGVYVWDAAAAWEDPTSALGEPLSGVATAYDYVHRSIAAGKRASKSLIRILSAILPQYGPSQIAKFDVYSAANNRRGNFLTNGLFQGTGGTADNGVSASGSPPGGATAGVAAGWRARRVTGQGDGTVAPSGSTTATAYFEAYTDADGNARGNRQCLSFTPGGAAVEFFGLNVADTVSSYQAGEWVRAAIEVDVSAYAGYRAIQLVARDTTASVGAAGFGLKSFNNGGNLLVYPSEAWSGLIETEPFKISTTNCTIRFQLEVAIDGAVAGTPLVKAGAARLRLVDDPRPLVGF